MFDHVSRALLENIPDLRDTNAKLGDSLVASGDDCANYCVTLFSDLSRYVTMQNLFHDGGFSFTGVSEAVVKGI